MSVNLVRALAELNEFDLHVVTSDKSAQARSVSKWAGVTIHRLCQAGRRILTDAIGPGRRQMQHYLRKLNPDLVHAHDVYGLMVKGLSIPRVFTVHGFMYGDVLVSGEPMAQVRSWIWKWIETRGWADQPHIISISPYVRERLRGIVTGTVHDIDNPISERFFQIERRETQRRIFSAAWISARKNTLGLLEGFHRVLQGGVRAELRLAGVGHDVHYVERVRRYITDHRLENHVILLGRINQEEVAEELALASIFVLASLEENSPMGIGEAMAAGLPIVTSNRCGMPYMVRDGESGFLIDPRDPDDIAWRLKQLLEAEELRHSMGEKSRQIALDRFHPNVVARRTRDVYLQCVNKGGPCRLL